MTRGRDHVGWRRGWLGRGWRALGVGLLLIGTAPASASTAHLLLAAGQYDAMRDRFPAQEFGLQYRDQSRVWRLQPMLGFMFNTRRAIYSYVGLSLDLWLAPDAVLLRPSFAAGLYDAGDSKDLGLGLEFRSGLELAFALSRRHRLGVELYHLSNANLAERNPGVESLVVNYTLTLGR